MLRCGTWICCCWIGSITLAYDPFQPDANPPAGGKLVNLQEELPKAATPNVIIQPIRPALGPRRYGALDNSGEMQSAVYHPAADPDFSPVAYGFSYNQYYYRPYYAYRPYLYGYGYSSYYRPSYYYGYGGYGGYGPYGGYGYGAPFFPSFGYFGNGFSSPAPYGAAPGACPYGGCYYW